MKTISIQELKKEMAGLPAATLLELCLRLAKFKKDNKELLAYLLFDANDLPGYLTLVKEEMDELFSGLNVSNLYLMKKSLRKILRLLVKYSRYTGSKQAEIELRIYFCRSLRKSGLPWERSQAISKLYSQQLVNIYNLMESLHEDLRYDYAKDVVELEAK